MKIKQEHLAEMEREIQVTILQADKPLVDFARAYRDAGLSDKRFMWDWLWASYIEGERATTWICDNLYSYLNDDHIDTALRHIFKTKVTPSKV